MKTKFTPAVARALNTRRASVSSAMLGAFLAVTLCSCTTLFAPQPPELAGIKLQGISSDAIDVLTPIIKREQGIYFLEGGVRRGSDVKTTAGMSVEISFRTTAGQIVKTETVQFSPRELPDRGGHPYHQGSYRVSLQDTPAGVSKIEVRVIREKW